MVMVIDMYCMNSSHTMHVIPLLQYRIRLHHKGEGCTRRGELHGEREGVGRGKGEVEMHGCIKFRVPVPTWTSTWHR